MLSFFNNTSAQYLQLASNFKFKSIDGDVLNLNDYKNNAFYSLSSACDLNYYYLFFELKDDGCYVDPMILDNLLSKL